MATILHSSCDNSTPRRHFYVNLYGQIASRIVQNLQQNVLNMGFIWSVFMGDRLTYSLPSQLKVLPLSGWSRLASKGWQADVGCGQLAEGGGVNEKCQVGTSWQLWRRKKLWENFRQLRQNWGKSEVSFSCIKTAFFTCDIFYLIYFSWFLEIFQYILKRRLSVQMMIEWCQVEPSGGGGCTLIDGWLEGKVQLGAIAIGGECTTGCKRCPTQPTRSK